MVKGTQSLRLQGCFSYIDKYGRIKIHFVDPDPHRSREKLAAACSGHLPYDAQYYTVCPRGHSGFSELVGRHVSLLVRASGYTIWRGESAVTGTCLYLIDMAPLADSR